MPSYWEQEVYPAWNDYYQVIFFSLLFPTARLLLNRLIFERLGRRVLHPTEKKRVGHHSDAGTKLLIKFQESSWKFLYYGVTWVYAFVITYPEPWFGNTAAFWEGWPGQSLKNKLKIYYTAQCGFYVYSVAALLFWETRRKDFGVMMTHHVVTVILLGYSYITGNFRVGSIVLALHDFSDILLEGAKLFKYAGNEAIASVLFGLFALSWLLLRLVYFPFWIIWSTSIELVHYATDAFKIKYYHFNTLLITLLAMHMYWWVLICRMIMKQLQNAGRVTDDVRSDDEDDD
eukprot:jgi/Mesen1/2075/ME000151S01335